MSLGPAVEFGQAGGAILLLADQGGLQTLFDEALPNPADGGSADVEGLGDAVIGPVRAARSGIRFE